MAPPTIADDPTHTIPIIVHDWQLVRLKIENGHKYIDNIFEAGTIVASPSPSSFLVFGDSKRVWKVSAAHRGGVRSDAAAGK
jgi:hypothetical protein